MDDQPNYERTTFIGRLYDTLKKAQEFAELAGLTVMAGQIRELRRRTHVSLTVSNTDEDPEAPPKD